MLDFKPDEVTHLTSQSIKELRTALHETYQALALVTFLSRRNHPDAETCAQLDALHERARAALYLKA